MGRVIHAILVGIVFLTSCHVEPDIYISDSNPPIFTFSSNTSTKSLIVCRVSEEYKEKGIPSSSLNPDNPNVTWIIETDHDDPKRSITYGVLPKDMKEIVKAQPLEEGILYFAVTSSAVGAYFTIKNGRTVRITNKSMIPKNEK
jgi:hypothetical protein